MKKYIVWLKCKNSDYKAFYEIVQAIDASAARNSVLNNKAYSDVIILEVKNYRAV